MQIVLGILVMLVFNTFLFFGTWHIVRSYEKKALEQQKAQQSGAAAQVAHPKPRLQPGKAAQQKGVGTGLEQAVIADEGESAGAEEFPVLQVDPPIG